MRRLLAVLLFGTLTACASAPKKGMLETYYTELQNVKYMPVMPPYSFRSYPVRWGEEVLRVWVAPRDSGLVFIDGHYMYIVVTKSRWYASPIQPPEEYLKEEK